MFISKIMVIYYKNVDMDFTLEALLYKALINKQSECFDEGLSLQICLNMKLIIVIIAKLLIFS